jgi:hypothetical protein
MTCKRCGSHAINHHLHGRDESEPELCDVCFWRKKAEDYARALETIFEVSKEIDLDT